MPIRVDLILVIILFKSTFINFSLFFKKKKNFSITRFAQIQITLKKVVVN